jgi:hypothetical protein
MLVIAPCRNLGTVPLSAPFERRMRLLYAIERVTTAVD